MPIDDPISAVETVAANEERASSPLQRFVDVILDNLPGDAAAAARRLITADRLDKHKLLVEAVVSHVRYHERRIAELFATSAEHRRFMSQDFFPLLLDALKKAEETRCRERVRRIGRIVANSAITSPQPDADEVEELMRVATQLTDIEVLLMDRLSSQANLAAVQSDGRPWLELALSWDPTSFCADLDLTVGEFEGICAKLSSLGLVRLTTETLAGFNSRPPIPVFLRKGLQFLRYIKAAGADI